MKNFKLKIDLLPKGAWNNDLSKTLPKKDWDTLREICYKKANHRCQICGEQTDDLDAHEVWEFNEEDKTQTLKDIIAICSSCHGVIHFKNSVRLGYGQQAKAHFLKVNKCSEMDFAGHLHQALIDYDNRNKILRWNIIANLDRFGGKNIELTTKNIPIINTPYDNINWASISYEDTKKLFNIVKDNSLIGAPKIISINVNNYQGIIHIKSLFADRIEWFLDGVKIKTKYNTIGEFSTNFCVEGLEGSLLNFKLSNSHGYLLSQNFKLNKL